MAPTMARPPPTPHPSVFGPSTVEVKLTHADPRPPPEPPPLGPRAKQTQSPEPHPVGSCGNQTRSSLRGVTRGQVSHQAPTPTILILAGANLDWPLHASLDPLLSLVHVCLRGDPIGSVEDQIQTILHSSGFSIPVSPWTGMLPLIPGVGMLLTNMRMSWKHLLAAHDAGIPVVSSTKGFRQCPPEWFQSSFKSSHSDCGGVTSRFQTVYVASHLPIPLLAFNPAVPRDAQPILTHSMERNCSTLDSLYARCA